MKRLIHGKRRVTAVAVALAMGTLSLGTIALASEVDVAVVDVTAPTGSVTLQPGQSAPITIRASVTGSQAGTATFEVNRDWELQENGTFTGTNPKEFTVGPRAGGDPATTFETVGTVRVASSVVTTQTKTLAVGAFDITNSNETGAKLAAGTSSGYSVTANVPVAPTDTTPPQISYTLNPADPDGNNGWYKSDVTLTWTVTENESPASLVKTGCNDQNVTADQAATTYSCSATSAGGTSSETVSIKRDANAPTLDCGTPPSGWQAANVVLDCTATEVGPSGLAMASDATFQLSTNVSAGSETSNAQTGTKTVTDSAGNTRTIGPFSFMVDRKAPTVSCDSPAPSFLLNQSPANVTGTAADGGSGPASQNISEAADTSSVGSGKTVTLTASDDVGNQGSAACSYSVGYKFDGFYSPVDNNNVLNGVKAGQAIPLKWRLLDANDNPVTGLSSVKVTVASLTCALGTTTDAVEEYAAGASGLQNLGNGYYQFNWKSPSTYAKSCKTLNLDLGEGSPRTALFQFTK